MKKKSQPDEQLPSWKKNLLPLLIPTVLVILSISLVLVITELVLRNYPDPLKPVESVSDYYQFNIETGLEPKPNVKYNEYGFDVEINKNGFFGPEIPLEKKGLRLAFLGDSYSDGPGIDFKDNYPYKLTEKIREQSGKEVDFVIGGFGGSSPLGQKVVYEKKIQPYHPDVVVYELYDNDVRDDYVYSLSSYAARLKAHSMIPQFLRGSRISKFVEASLAKGITRFYEQKYEKTKSILETRPDEVWEKYTKPSLDEMLAKSKVNNSKFVLFYIPSGWEFDNEYAENKKGTTRFFLASAASSWASAHEVPFVDMYDWFIPYNTEQINEIYLPGEKGYHLNEFGASLVTDQLEKVVIPLLKLPSQPQTAEEIESQKKKIEAEYWRFPGNVPNVFGWGYNRSSCNISPTIAVNFFYTFSGSIYYNNSDNLQSAHELPLGEKVNPDYDVYCREGNIYLTYSDIHQQKLYQAVLQYGDGWLRIEKKELVYDGGGSYTAVAPSAKYVSDTHYISFMSYGLTGSSTPDSVVHVSHRQDNEWSTQDVFKHSAANTQVLGSSLVRYQDSLLLFITPNPGGIWISKLDPKTHQWTAAKPQPQLQTRGQLEWQNLTDRSGNVHLIFRDDNGTLNYAQLRDKQWSLTSFPGTLSINSSSIFETVENEVYILFNDSQLSRVIDKTVSTPIKIKGLSNFQNFYFLKVPSPVVSRVNSMWLGGGASMPRIYYGSFELSDYKEKLTEKIKSETRTFSLVPID